jgi:hypothetical protein
MGEVTAQMSSHMEEAMIITGRPAQLILLASVARRYYLEGRSKVEIADELGLSRFKVARLLDAAWSSLMWPTAPSTWFATPPASPAAPPTSSTPPRSYPTQQPDALSESSPRSRGHSGGSVRSPRPSSASAFGPRVSPRL